MDHVAGISGKFSLTARHVVDFKVGQGKKGIYFRTYSISPRRRKQPVFYSSGLHSLPSYLHSKNPLQ